MLSALSHYLQQLPLAGQDTARPAGAAPATADSSGPATDTSSSPYAPSARAVLVSAVAADFNVRALSSPDVGALQGKLLQFGLLNGRDLDAFSVIHTARSDLEDGQTLDALQLVDEISGQFSERQIPYSERQQIGRLQTLLHNLDSARQTH